MNYIERIVRLSENTLSRRLLFYVIICSSFFTLISTVVQLFLDYKNEVDNINNTINFVEESYIESITASVYHVDTRLINLQLNGILKLPDIIYLEVKDSNSEPSYSYSAGNRSGKRDFEKIFPLVYIGKNKEKEFVGYLRAYVSYKYIYSRILDRAIVVVMTNAIKVFFSSIVLFIIFQTIVTKHLIRISTYIKEMDLKTLDNPVKLERAKLISKEDDELDLMVKSLNNMRNKMRSDISKRDIAENELEHLKNYLTDILNSLPSAVIGVDRAGIVTQWNSQAEKLTGYLESNAIGKDFTELFPEVAAEDFMKSAVGGKPFNRYRLKRVKSDRIFYEDISSFPLISSNGVEGAVIRVDDVTEQVRMDAVIVQNEKMMSVGGLAAGIAHEINTPLAIMMQSAQNIERRVSDDLEANLRVAESCGITLEAIRLYMEKRNILRGIGDIRMYGEKAATIVSDILKFSQLSSDTYEKVELTELLDQSLRLASHDFDTKKNYDFKKIKIIREYESSVEANIIRIEIEQVILNLLKNGAYSMGDIGKEPVFVVRCYKENGFSVIEIEDNGVGMEEDVMGRIFEPFYTTKPVGIGTGLGLSVSFMIITKNHKGTLSVSSYPSKGTKFTIKIPGKM
jgi:PAS domain S-box-containing protein